jgi:hypothetical protein
MDMWTTTLLVASLLFIIVVLFVVAFLCIWLDTDTVHRCRFMPLDAVHTGR